MRILLNKKTFSDFYGHMVTPRTKNSEYKVIKLLRKQVKDAGKNEKSLNTLIVRTARKFIKSNFDEQSLEFDDVDQATSSPRTNNQTTQTEKAPNLPILRSKYNLYTYRL